MKCQSCGSEVKEGAKFCRECGTKVVEKTEGIVCPKCGKQLRAGVVFCNECGTRLSEPAETLADNVLTCSCCGNKLKADAMFCGRCGNAVNRTQHINIVSNDKTVKKKDKGLIFLIVLLIFVIIGSAAVIGYVYYQNNSINMSISHIDDKSDRKNEKKKQGAVNDKTKNDKTEIKEEMTEENEDLQDVLIEEENEEEYLFPSDREYITELDLAGKSKDEVAMIRNEIYARHGYIFSTEPSKSYFEAKDWYVPNPSFTDSVFNEIEKANKDFLVNYEKEKGWR